MTPQETLNLIKSKCREDGGCWIWLGALQHCGTTPVMRIPGGSKTTGVRRLVMQCCKVDLTGKLATNTCESPLCVAPDHIVAMTRKQLQIRSAKHMTLGSKVRRAARVAQHSRQRGKLTAEVVELLPASRLPLTELARYLGVNRESLWRAATGRTWAPVVGANPFLGLMR